MEHETPDGEAKCPHCGGTHSYHPCDKVNQKGKTLEEVYKLEAIASALNKGHCPMCGTKEGVTVMGAEAPDKNNVIIADVFCKGCQVAWMDHYEYVGFKYEGLGDKTVYLKTDYQLLKKQRLTLATMLDQDNREDDELRLSEEEIEALEGVLNHLDNQADQAIKHFGEDIEKHDFRTKPSNT